MIRISGITLSNPSDTQEVNNVKYYIYNSGMALLVEDYLINHGTSDWIIDYTEPSAGTYYVKIIDTTSTESCELSKSIVIEEVFNCIADFVATYFDSSFNTGTNLNEYGGYCIVESNNKYVVGGSFTQYNSDRVNNLVNIEYNGGRNSGFTTNSTSYFINKIIPVGDGSYIIFGNFSSNKCIIRINANGAKDVTFELGSAIYFNDNGDVIKINDNNFIVAGQAEGFNGISKFSLTGIFDTSFNSGGAGFSGDSYVFSLYYDETNNKILVGGKQILGYNTTPTPNNSLIRLNMNGTLDDTFMPSIVATYGIKTITMHNGSYIVAGYEFIYKISSSGVIDTAFNNGGSGFLGGSVNRIIVDSNNKLMCVGSFTSYNGTSVGGIVRILSNGAIDPSFNSGGSGFTYDPPKDIIEDQYNRYVVVGAFKYYNYNNLFDTNYASGMIRLNQDGSVNM